MDRNPGTTAASRPPLRLATAATALLLLAAFGASMAVAASAAPAPQFGPVQASVSPGGDAGARDAAGAGEDGTSDAALATPLTDQEDFQERLQQILLEYLTTTRHNHCGPLCVCPPIC